MRKLCVAFTRTRTVYSSRTNGNSSSHVIGKYVKYTLNEKLRLLQSVKLHVQSVWHAYSV